MKSTKSDGKKQVLKLDGLSLRENASRVLKNIPRPKNTSFIARLEVKPNEQTVIPLGSFTAKNQPKGFLIEMDPDPNPNDSIVTEVTYHGGKLTNVFDFHIANFGSRTVHAEVWQL
jgi:hypothetical protein